MWECGKGRHEVLLGMGKMLNNGRRACWNEMFPCRRSIVWKEKGKRRDAGVRGRRLQMTIFWRWLWFSLSSYNEPHKLELLGAWKPSNRTCVIPQNLYPRIKVILISRIRRICNFIGKYRLNVKDCRNWILVGYWKKSYIVLSAKNSMRDFTQNSFNTL